MKCLLLITNDRRKFLTSTENLWSLIEFVKIFNAKIFRAVIDPKEEKNVLELKDLANAICDSAYESNPKCEIKEQLYPKDKASKKDKVKITNQIDEHIRKELLAKRQVSMQGLKKKYEQYKLTDACLCIHFTKVRNNLTAEGHPISRVKRGVYVLSSDN